MRRLNLQLDGVRPIFAAIADELCNRIAEICDETSHVAANGGS